MTRTTTIRFTKDVLVVAFTFVLLGLARLPILVGGTHLDSSFVGTFFERIPAVFQRNFTLENYQAVFASGFAVYIRNSLLVTFRRP